MRTPFNAPIAFRSMKEADGAYVELGDPAGWEARLCFTSNHPGSKALRAYAHLLERLPYVGSIRQTISMLDQSLRVGRHHVTMQLLDGLSSGAHEIRRLLGDAYVHAVSDTVANSVMTFGDNAAAKDGGTAKASVIFTEYEWEENALSPDPAWVAQLWFSFQATSGLRELSAPEQLRFETQLLTSGSVLFGTLSGILRRKAYGKLPEVFNAVSQVAQKVDWMATK
jgi:hypothetical protein